MATTYNDIHILMVVRFNASPVAEECANKGGHAHVHIGSRLTCVVVTCNTGYPVRLQLCSDNSTQYLDGCMGRYMDWWVDGCVLGSAPSGKL